MGAVAGFIDATARRPAGRGARIYAHPTRHERSFELVLAALQLGDGDSLVELGFGGGVLLEVELRAAGFSHVWVAHTFGGQLLGVAQRETASRG